MNDLFPQELFPSEQPAQWVDVVGDRVMVRVIVLRAHMQDGVLMGQIVPQHVHADDHFTMIVKGAVRVWVDDELRGDAVAPKAILIERGKCHKFQALQDDTIMVCNHMTDGKGEPAILSEGKL